jgi:Holliday junction DNA helicase RuvB
MLASIVGQQKLKDRLTKLITDGGLPHLLLSGPAEMGKKTIAMALASELCDQPQVLDVLTVKTVLDVTGVLTNMLGGQSQNVLVVLSLNSLSSFVKEKQIILEAISNFSFSIQIGAGPGSRVHQVPLPRFTMIATTEGVWQLDPQLRRWFVVEDLEPYSQSEISELIERLASVQGFTISRDASHEIARHANGSPGQAEVLLKRIAAQKRTAAIDLFELRRVLDRLGLTHPAASLDLATRLNAMSGVEFENWVADYFRSRGYAVEPTPTTGDHGIDLILRKDSAVFGVQCKRWNDVIGEPVLRDFYGSVSNGNFAGGFVVTTSSFTDPARVFAKGKPITLVGLADLIQTTLFSEKQL